MNASLISYRGGGWSWTGVVLPSVSSTTVLVYALQTWADMCNYNHIIVLGTQGGTCLSLLCLINFVFKTYRWIEYTHTLSVSLFFLWRLLCRCVMLMASKTVID